MTAYDLPPVTELRALSIGNNITFEVVTGRVGDHPQDPSTSDGRFVLRIHRPAYRTLAHIRSELHFLQVVHKHLAGFAVSVPQPVPARDGSLVVEANLPPGSGLLAGPRHCDLLTWVAGDVLLPGSGLGQGALHSLGRALGLIHNAADDFDPPAGFELPRWDADGMFTTAASPFRPVLSLDEILSPTDRRLFDEIADRTRAIFAALEQQSHSTSGLIHFDYILGNCHLHSAGGQWHAGVIDFDDCGWGYFLYDLCPLLGNLAGYPGAVADNPDYPALRSAYLEGYRTARPLPAAWESYLPVLMAARNASQCLWTAGLGQSPTPREDAVWRMSLARRCLELPPT